MSLTETEPTVNTRELLMAVGRHAGRAALEHETSSQAWRDYESEARGTIDALRALPDDAVIHIGVSEGISDDIRRGLERTVQRQDGVASTNDASNFTTYSFSRKNIFFDRDTLHTRNQIRKVRFFATDDVRAVQAHLVDLPLGVHNINLYATHA